VSLILKPNPQFVVAEQAGNTTAAHPSAKFNAPLVDCCPNADTVFVS
jgi:hypothetical protein